jgi:hypothetical protein
MAMPKKVEIVGIAIVDQELRHSAAIGHFTQA